MGKNNPTKFLLLREGSSLTEKQNKRLRRGSSFGGRVSLG